MKKIIGLVAVLLVLAFGVIYYSSYEEIDAEPIILSHDNAAISHTINASKFSYLKHITSNIKGITTANITITADNVKCIQVQENQSGKMINLAKCEAQVTYVIGRYENNTFMTANITNDVIFSHPYLTEAIVENSDEKVIRTTMDGQPVGTTLVFKNGTYTLLDTAYFNVSGNYKWNDRIGATVLDPYFTASLD